MHAEVAPITCAITSNSLAAGMWRVLVTETASCPVEGDSSEVRGSVVESASVKVQFFRSSVHWLRKSKPSIASAVSPSAIANVTSTLWLPNLTGMVARLYTVSGDPSTVTSDWPGQGCRSGGLVDVVRSQISFRRRLTAAPVSTINNAAVFSAVPWTW